jgi:hypothetical protein
MASPGMIALTGIVFSLMFLMAQLSATAYPTPKDAERQKAQRLGEESWQRRSRRTRGRGGREWPAWQAREGPARAASL